ncbi:hypothetical protein PO909_013003 [Leuciscus waleckii]
MQIASGDMSYNLPSRRTIMSRIHSLCDSERARRMDILEKAKYAALTGDHWTSVSNDNYFAHLIDEEWRLRSFALTVSQTTERHFAEACTEHFLEVAKEWKVEQKLTLGTDSARNMTAAARLLPFEHLPCTAHSVQRTITVSLRDCGFDSLLAKCRKIVGHFNPLPSNAQELAEQQVALGQKQETLVQDVATRWNSTLEMVKRIQRNQSSLSTTLAQQNSKIVMFTAQELAKLQKLEELLEPCRLVNIMLVSLYLCLCVCSVFCVRLCSLSLSLSA